MTKAKQPAKKVGADSGAPKKSHKKKASAELVQRPKPSHSEGNSAEAISDPNDIGDIVRQELLKTPGLQPAQRVRRSRKASVRRPPCSGLSLCTALARAADQGQTKAAPPRAALASPLLPTRLRRGVRMYTVTAALTYGCRLSANPGTKSGYRGVRTMQEACNPM